MDVIATNTVDPEWLRSINYYLRDEPHKLQRQVSENCHNVQLLNHFTHYGPNGNHFIMVFEVLGVNLLEIMKRYDYKGIPIPLVRKIAKQILMGLDFLHRPCKIIHTDLKPENCVLSLSKSELDEVLKRGQISTMNKTIKTMDVVSNNFFLPKGSL